MERLKRNELLGELESMHNIFQEEFYRRRDRMIKNKQAYKQIEELIMCEDMVQQYRDEKEMEQAEIEGNYIDIILDLYERLEEKSGN